jgi:hypothetical protein
MFGFGKRAAPQARSHGEARRDEAIAATREALEQAANLLTHELRAIGADCAQLAGSGRQPTVSVAAQLRQALTFNTDTGRASLRLCKVLDEDRFDFAPHFRYREIHLVVDDIERKTDDPEGRRRIVHQHGLHALLQARLLTTFLSLVGPAERLLKTGRVARLDPFLDDATRAFWGVLALPARQDAGLDRQAIMREWLGLPAILVRHDESGTFSRGY